MKTEDTFASKAIYWIDGSRDGVGRSMVAIGLIDCLKQQGHKVLLIEGSADLQDVWTIWWSDIDAALGIDLTGRGAGQHLVDVCAEHPEEVVVIHGPGWTRDGARQSGRILNRAAEMLRRRLVALWVINRCPDSFERLAELKATMNHAAVHVVRNGLFAPGAQLDRKRSELDASRVGFEAYDRSEVRKAVESMGGKSVTFPRLETTLADAMFIKRVSPRSLASHLDLRGRVELELWRDDVREAMKEIVEA